MRGSSVKLLTNASATGAAQDWPGGRGTLSVAGTFNGATVKLQVLGPDSTTWIDAGTYTTFTAAGLGNFDLPLCKIRAAVTGGSSPTGLYAVAVNFNM